MEIPVYCEFQDGGMEEMLALIERLYGLPNLGVGDVSLRWGSTPLGSFKVKCFAFYLWGLGGLGTTLV